jgi:antitoxin component of MazEF toxin-antitoxin module
MLKRKLMKINNGYRISIPKDVIEFLKMENEDEIVLTIENGKITISKKEMI